MPSKATSKEIVEAINHLATLLKKKYGDDYSYAINGNGFTIARHNIAGIDMPTPIMEDKDNNRGL